MLLHLSSDGGRGRTRFWITLLPLIFYLNYRNTVQKLANYRVPPYRTPPQLQRFYDEENCSSVLQCAIENKVKHDESLRLIIMERYHYTSNRIISTKTIDWCLIQVRSMSIWGDLYHAGLWGFFSFLLSHIIVWAPLIARRESLSSPDSDEFWFLILMHSIFLTRTLSEANDFLKFWN